MPDRVVQNRAVKSKNTKLEVAIRSGLHRSGFRFRLHVKELPGKPDIVLKKYNAAIFVNGCFWHGHDCEIYRPPSTNTDYWKEKIANTQHRDLLNKTTLTLNDWKVLTIWECSLRGKNKLSDCELMRNIVDWIRFGIGNAEVRGKHTATSELLPTLGLRITHL